MYGPHAFGRGVTFRCTGCSLGFCSSGELHSVTTEYSSEKGGAQFSYWILFSFLQSQATHHSSTLLALKRSIIRSFLHILAKCVLSITQMAEIGEPNLNLIRTQGNRSGPIDTQDFLTFLLTRTSMTLDQVVRTPAGIHRSAWVYFLVVQICLDLNQIIVALLDNCCRCDKMCIEEFEYLCAAHRGKPRMCSAISYSVHSLDFAISRLTGRSTLICCSTR